MLEAKVVGLLNQKKEIKTMFNVDFLVNHFCLCVYSHVTAYWGPCLADLLPSCGFGILTVHVNSKSVQNEMLMLTSLSIYPNDSLM